MRLLLALAMLAPVAAPAQTASFELLPSEVTSIRALSPDGGAFVFGGPSEYSVWVDGVATPFTPPACGDGFTPIVLAVSNDGIPKGFVRGISPTSWVWDGEECRAATGPEGGVVLLSTVTPDGTHAAGDVNIHLSDATTRGGYIWNDGSGTYIPPPSGDHNRSLRLDRISDDGSTVAGYESPDNATTRALLIRGGVKTLVPSSGSFASVLDLSADGAIALAYDFDVDGMGGILPFLLEGGSPTAVPLLPGAMRGGPVAMSGDGTRLAGSLQFGTDATVRDAVIWEDLAPRLLRDLLADHGIAPDSIPPNLHVTDISTDGRVIIGRAQDGGITIGVWRAVLPRAAVWAGGANGAWDEPEHWSPALVPDALVAAIVVASTPGPTITLRRNEAAASLAVTARDAGAPPPVVLALGGHTLTLGPAPDALIVGPGDSGALDLDGGTLVVDGSAVLGRAADAQGIVTVGGGHTLAIEGGLTVGGGGTDPTGSALLVFDGTVTTVAGLLVGERAGVTGLVSLWPGTSLQNTVAASTSVGSEGVGVLDIDGAFVSHTGPVYLGAFETGQGRVDLQNRASMLTTDSLFVGLRGTGELSVTDGSGLSTGPTVLGDREGSVGSARVAGTGSRWDIAGNLVVGEAGAAVLEVVEEAFLCLGGASRLGAQGRVITDATLRVELLVDCAALSRTGAGGDQAGILTAGLTVASGADIEAEAIEVGEGASLGGDGALATPVVNNGTLAPGGEDAIGTLALSAPLTLAASGALSVEIGADAADAIVLDEPVVLGGTLRLRAAPGETPTVGDRFEIVTAPSVSGAFERVEAPEGLEVELTATAVVVNVTGVVNAEDTPEASLTLRATPNPARGALAVRFAVPETGEARLTLHDALGRIVAVLADGLRLPGEHEARLDVSGLAPGVYLVHLTSGAQRLVRRLTVVR